MFARVEKFLPCIFLVLVGSGVQAQESRLRGCAETSATAPENQTRSYFTFERLCDANFNETRDLLEKFHYAPTVSAFLDAPDNYTLLIPDNSAIAAIPPFVFNNDSYLQEVVENLFVSPPLQNPTVAFFRENGSYPRENRTGEVELTVYWNAEDVDIPVFYLHGQKISTNKSPNQNDTDALLYVLEAREAPLPFYMREKLANFSDSNLACSEYFLDPVRCESWALTLVDQSVTDQSERGVRQCAYDAATGNCRGPGASGQSDPLIFPNQEFHARFPLEERVGKVCGKTAMASDIVLLEEIDAEFACSYLLTSDEGTDDTSGPLGLELTSTIHMWAQNVEKWASNTGVVGPLEYLRRTYNPDKKYNEMDGTDAPELVLAIPHNMVSRSHPNFILEDEDVPFARLSVPPYSLSQNFSVSASGGHRSHLAMEIDAMNVFYEHRLPSKTMIDRAVLNDVWGGDAQRSPETLFYYQNGFSIDRDYYDRHVSRSAAHIFSRSGTTSDRESVSVINGRCMDPSRPLRRMTDRAPFCVVPFLRINVSSDGKVGQVGFSDGLNYGLRADMKCRLYRAKAQDNGTYAPTGTPYTASVDCLDLYGYTSAPSVGGETFNNIYGSMVQALRVDYEQREKRIVGMGLGRSFGDGDGNLGAVDTVDGDLVFVAAASDQPSSAAWNFPAVVLDAFKSTNVDGGTATSVFLSYPSMQDMRTVIPMARSVCIENDEIKPCENDTLSAPPPSLSYPNPGTDNCRPYVLRYEVVPAPPDTDPQNNFKFDSGDNICCDYAASRLGEQTIRLGMATAEELEAIRIEEVLNDDVSVEYDWFTGCGDNGRTFEVLGKSHDTETGRNSYQVTYKPGNVDNILQAEGEQFYTMVRGNFDQAGFEESQWYDPLHVEDPYCSKCLKTFTDIPNNEGLDSEYLIPESYFRSCEPPLLDGVQDDTFSNPRNRSLFAPMNRADASVTHSWWDVVATFPAGNKVDIVNRATLEKEEHVSMTDESIVSLPGTTDYDCFDPGDSPPIQTIWRDARRHPAVFSNGPAGDDKQNRMLEKDSLCDVIRNLKVPEMRPYEELAKMYDQNLGSKMSYMTPKIGDAVSKYFYYVVVYPASTMSEGEALNRSRFAPISPYDVTDMNNFGLQQRGGLFGSPNYLGTTVVDHHLRCGLGGVYNPSAAMENKTTSTFMGFTSRSATRDAASDDNEKQVVYDGAAPDLLAKRRHASIESILEHMSSVNATDTIRSDGDSELTAHVINPYDCEQEDRNEIAKSKCGGRDPVRYRFEPIAIQYKYEAVLANNHETQKQMKYFWNCKDQVPVPTGLEPTLIQTVSASLNLFNNSGMKGLAAMVVECPANTTVPATVGEAVKRTEMLANAVMASETFKQNDEKYTPDDIPICWDSLDIDQLVKKPSGDYVNNEKGGANRGYRRVYAPLHCPDDMDSDLAGESHNHSFPGFLEDGVEREYKMLNDISRLGARWTHSYGPDPIHDRTERDMAMLLSKYFFLSNPEIQNAGFNDSIFESLDTNFSSVQELVDSLGSSLDDLVDYMESFGDFFFKSGNVLGTFGRAGTQTMDNGYDSQRFAERDDFNRFVIGGTRQSGMGYEDGEILSPLTHCSVVCSRGALAASKTSDSSLRQMSLRGDSYGWIPQSELTQVEPATELEKALFAAVPSGGFSLDESEKNLDVFASMLNYSLASVAHGRVTRDAIRMCTSPEIANAAIEILLGSEQYTTELLKVVMPVGGTVQKTPISVADLIASEGSEVSACSSNDTICFPNGLQYDGQDRSAIFTNVNFTDTVTKAVGSFSKQCRSLYETPQYLPFVVGMGDPRTEKSLMSQYQAFLHAYQDTGSSKAPGSGESIGPLLGRLGKFHFQLSKMHPDIISAYESDPSFEVDEVFGFERSLKQGNEILEDVFDGDQLDTLIPLHFTDISRKDVKSPCGTYSMRENPDGVPAGLRSYSERNGGVWNYAEIFTSPDRDECDPINIASLNQARFLGYEYSKDAQDLPRALAYGAERALAFTVNVFDACSSQEGFDNSRSSVIRGNCEIQIYVPPHLRQEVVTLELAADFGRGVVIPRLIVTVETGEYDDDVKSSGASQTIRLLQITGKGYGTHGISSSRGFNRIGRILVNTLIVNGETLKAVTLGPVLRGQIGSSDSFSEFEERFDLNGPPNILSVTPGRIFLNAGYFKSVALDAARSQVQCMLGSCVCLEQGNGNIGRDPYVRSSGQSGLRVYLDPCGYILGGVVSYEDGALDVNVTNDTPILPLLANPGSITEPSHNYQIDVDVDIYSHSGSDTPQSRNQTFSFPGDFVAMIEALTGVTEAVNTSILVDPNTTNTNADDSIDSENLPGQVGSFLGDVLQQYLEAKHEEAKTSAGGSTPWDFPASSSYSYKLKLDCGRKIQKHSHVHVISGEEFYRDSYSYKRLKRSKRSHYASLSGLCPTTVEAEIELLSDFDVDLRRRRSTADNGVVRVSASSHATCDNWCTTDYNTQKFSACQLLSFSNCRGCPFPCDKNHTAVKRDADPSENVVGASASNVSDLTEDRDSKVVCKTANPGDCDSAGASRQNVDTSHLIAAYLGTENAISNSTTSYIAATLDPFRLFSRVLDSSGSKGLDDHPLIVVSRVVNGIPKFYYIGANTPFLIQDGDKLVYDQTNYTSADSFNFLAELVPGIFSDHRSFVEAAFAQFQVPVADTPADPGDSGTGTGGSGSDQGSSSGTDSDSDSDSDSGGLNPQETSLLVILTLIFCAALLGVIDFSTSRLKGADGYKRLRNRLGAGSTEKFASIYSKLA